MKLHWIAAALLVPGGVFAQVPAGLTIDEAITIARQNNRLVKIAAARVDAATAKADEANAGLLPSLKFEGSYRRLSDIDPFAVSLPFLPAPVVISPTVLNNYAARVGVQQPLFTGFRLRSNARSADRLADAAAADARNDRADLVVNVAGAYWGLYQAGELKKSADENLRRLEVFEKDAEALLQSGLATRNDLLRIQVQRSNATLTRIDAENDLQLAAMNLNNILGRSLDQPVAVASVPGSGGGGDTTGPGGETPAGLIERALKDRPDLLGMQFRLEASRAAVTAAQGSWWPQILFSANYYYSRPNPRLLPTQDIFKGTWDVGVGVQLDLWNWGTTAAQTEQARAQMRQTEFMLSQMQDNAALDIRRQQLALRRALEKVDVARLAVGQAEENLRITTEKYRNGLSTTADLLDADVMMQSATTSLTGALVEFELARVRRARALGLLD